MKIDVEGAELAVIYGAQELLRTSRPTLLIEADPEPAAAAVTARLEEAGYVLATPAGFSPVNRLFRPASPSAAS